MEELGVEDELELSLLELVLVLSALAGAAALALSLLLDSVLVVLLEDVLAPPLLLPL